jgi:signal transduction histidine kinase/PAS domain-containing protein
MTGAAAAGTAEAAAPAASGPVGQDAARTAWSQVRALLPRGLSLPQATWEARHSFVLWVLAGHAAALPVFGLRHGWPLAFAVAEPLAIGVLAAGAAVPRLDRRVRSSVAALALALSSLVVIQFSGGLVEAHFHAFIAVALVALYQDWIALVLSLGLLVGAQAAAAAVEPALLFTHGSSDPWTWTLVDAVAVLGEAAALLAFWSSAEQARARSALVLDAVGDGVVGLDAHGQVTFANPAAARLVGRPVDGLIGRDIRAFLEGVAEGQGATPGPVRGVLHRADGPLHVEWTLTALQRTASGIGRVLVLRDVTARRELEERLARRSRQQETVAGLARAALESHELGMVLDRAARDTADTLGVGFAAVEQSVPGQPSLVLRAGIGWADLGRAPVAVDLSVLPGVALNAPEPVVVHDFARDEVSLPPQLRNLGVASAVAVAIPGPTVPWGVLTAYSRTPHAFSEDDVTFVQAMAALLATAVERIAIEDELRAHRLDLEEMVSRRTAQLTEANRELEAFSYTVSHDLRSPLRTIDGFSRILLQRHGRDLPDDSRRMLGLLSDGALRMGNLIESVLTLSRLGRIPLAIQPVDLSAAAHGILRDLEARHPMRKVDWQVQPGLVAQGDPGLLRVALENLLGNAWKFTERTAQPRIRIRGLTVQGAPALAVDDNGAGFDMAHARDLFQPFHRLHPPSQFDGTGIGLATVKRIVQRHGGRAWAEAAPGRGATFMFTLAAESAVPPAAPPVQKAPEVPLVRLVEAAVPSKGEARDRLRELL